MNVDDLKLALSPALDLCTIDEHSDLSIVPDSLFSSGSSRHEGGRVLRENCYEAGEETLLQVASFSLALRIYYCML
jgi:hypothetical protein